MNITFKQRLLNSGFFGFIGISNCSSLHDKFRKKRVKLFGNLNNRQFKSNGIVTFTYPDN